MVKTLFLLSNANFKLKTNKMGKFSMSEFLNINSTSFLGGQNIHNVVKIALASFIVFKLVKK